MNKYDVIVIGGGPAGVMCAIEAASNGNTVALLDINGYLLRKLSVSGGGRCNISNTLTRDDFFAKTWNAKFFYSTFSNFSNLDLVDWLNDNGLKTKVEKTKVFPVSDKSQEIVDLFFTKLKNSGVKYFPNTQVIDVEKISDGFRTTTSMGNVFSNKVVIATGGVTYSKLGATDFAINTAKKFGIETIEPYATNCSLELAISDKLMGVSIPNATVRYGKKKITGEILFTHFGITGPAIFAITGENVTHPTISVSVSDITIDKLKEVANTSNRTLANTFRNVAPEKYVYYVMANDGELIGHSATREALARVHNALTNYEFKVKGKSNIDRAFTMGGGIKLDQISPRTFESKAVEGLYFIGECLDYFAPTGGFNLSLCISMGKTCGEKL